MSKKFSLARIILFLGFFSFLGIGVLAWEIYRFYKSEFPDVTRLRREYPHILRAPKSGQKLVEWSRTPPSDWVDLGQVSSLAQSAIVVSEDWAFFSHHGYDPNQLKEAIEESLRAQSFARGASTITQQVVKNVFLTPDKTIWRKVRELILAIQLEERVTKKKILETYLNIAEMGENLYGINNASRYYFDKAPSQLTAKEGAFLAMLLPSPKKYSVSYRNKELTPFAKKTVDRILEKMVQAGKLSEEDLKLAQNTPLSFEQKGLTELRGSVENEDSEETQKDTP